MCVVERQKIEGKQSQHKHFGSHGEQIHSSPACTPQIQKLPCSPTSISSNISISTRFNSTPVLFHSIFQVFYFPNLP